MQALVVYQLKCTKVERHTLVKQKEIYLYEWKSTRLEWEQRSINHHASHTHNSLIIVLITIKSKSLTKQVIIINFTQRDASHR